MEIRFFVQSPVSYTYPSKTAKGALDKAIATLPSTVQQAVDLVVPKAVATAQ